MIMLRSIKEVRVVNQAMNQRGEHCCRQRRGAREHVTLEYLVDPHDLPEYDLEPDKRDQSENPVLSQKSSTRLCGCERQGSLQV